MQIEQIKLQNSSTAPEAVSKIPVVEKAAPKNMGNEKAGQKQPDMAKVTEVAADLEQNLRIMHDVDLKFTVHRNSGRVIVTVRDESTGKVIREIPPKEVLDLAAKFDEMIGQIFDQQS